MKDNIFIEFIVSLLLIAGALVLGLEDGGILVLGVIIGISIFFLIRILYALKDIVEELRKQNNALLKK